MQIICKPGTKFANRLQTLNGPCLANSVEIQWKFNGFAGEIQWKFNGNSKTEICKSGREPKGLAQKQNGSRGRQNLGRPSPKVVSRLSPSERPGDAPNRCVAFRTPCRNREQTSAGFRGWKSVVRTGIWKFKSCANSLLFNFFFCQSALMKNSMVFRAVFRTPFGGHLICGFPIWGNRSQSAT